MDGSFGAAALRGLFLALVIAIGVSFLLGIGVGWLIWG